MLEIYDKIQRKEWEIINKASEKSTFAGCVTAFAVGAAEGLVVALTEIAVIKVIVKVVSAIKGRS